MAILEEPTFATRFHYPLISWAEILIAGYFVLSFFLSFMAANFTFYFFTPVAVALGVFLYFVMEDGYVEFIWWLWFLTPCVRRIVDLSVGYTSQSQVMLAPLVVTMICMLRLFPQFFAMSSIEFFGFAAVILSLSFGFFVGAVTAGPMAALYGLANWGLPVIFCIYLTVRSERYQEFFEVTSRSMIVGSIVMGLYGIYQFFYLPAWDAYWMINANMASQGEAAPTLVRVFGTMNSSGPYAIAVMVGLLFIVARTGTFGWLAGIVPLTGLLLTLVRSSWIGLAIGLIVLMARAQMQKKLRFAIGIGVTLLLVLSLLSVTQLSTLVSERFQTLFALQADDSYRSRVEFQSKMIDVVFSDFFGAGIGTNGTATKLADVRYFEFTDFDSGLLAIPFTLGILGAVFYIGGFLVLCLRACFSATNSSAEQAAIATLAATGFISTAGNIFTGSTAVILWGMIGLLLSAHKFRGASSIRDGVSTERT